MGEKRSPYRILGKPEGKRLVGGSGRSWVDNIKIDLREIGWDGMDWTDLAQNRENGNEILSSTKCWEVLE
jgi:hypothetical protein